MEALKSTVYENIGGIGHSLAPSEYQFDIDTDVPPQDGKVAVITGGSQGIGYGTMFTLLKHHISKVFVISLSKEVVDRALKDITEKLGKEYADKVHWIYCDLGDWLAVTKAAKKIQEQTKRLDVLVLNAARGVMTYQLTDYGVDRHMAVNHFGHVILTSHLLPLLKSTAQKGNTVRISTQGSNAHQAAPSDVKFETLEELNQDLGPNGQYGRSKLATMLYARCLARHLSAAHPNILANTAHPGFVSTKMSTEDVHEPYPIAGFIMSKVIEPFKKDQWEGCVSQVFTATKTEKTGEYICPPAKPEAGSPLAQNEELGERLMRLTREVILEKFPKESAGQGCPFKFY